MSRSGANYEPALTKRFYGVLYGVKADGKTVSDAAISAGQATLSSAAAAFTKADAGKLCVVVGAGTPVSTTTTAQTGTSAITALAVNALASAIAPGGITIDDGAGGHSQTFVTTGALAGATSIPLIGPLAGGTSAALSTGAPITSIPVAALDFAVSAGLLTLVYLDAANTLHTQTFTASAAAVGATAITVTSATPNFAFPAGTIIFGSPANFSNAADKPTPTFNFPSGSTVKTYAPALSTTIQSVSGGVATLAANAGTSVAGGECFYATDDTAAYNRCKADAEAAQGTIVLLDGDMGISATLSSTAAIDIEGQGVRELYGGLSAHDDANWPTQAPYFKGSVIVQCAPNADILNLGAPGISQGVRRLGLRFAGKHLNTGNGLTMARSGGALSDIGGVIEDVRVFGTDGNHYGFPLDSNELADLVRLRAYGGGGFKLATNATDPGPPGNSNFENCYSCTFIAGIAQSWLIDGSSSPVGLNSNTYILAQMSVRVPVTPVNAAPPRAGGVQNCIRTFNAVAMTLHQFDDPGGESDVLRGVNSWPTGPGCARSNDFNASFAKVAQDKPNSAPVSGSAYQNLHGKPLNPYHEYVLQPAAASTASATTTSALAAGATLIPVQSTTGIPSLAGVQITSTAGKEYTAVASINDATHLTIVSPGAWGLVFGHASGALIEVGAAVVFAETSPSLTFPSARSARAGAAIGTQPLHLPVKYELPTSFYHKVTWANATRAWTDFPSLA